LQCSGGIDLSTGFAGAKAKTVEQPEQVGFLMRSGALIHEGSQARRPLKAQDLKRHHRKQF
jgi:EAL domain-containing protein (putative c-di-GMP-specific phosphodiesterase class I)